MTNKLSPTSTHWGNYLIEANRQQLKAVHAYSADLEPSPLAQSLLNSFDTNCRITQPMVRAGYLKQRQLSDGSMRGAEPFVPISWELALELAGDALAQVKQHYGNQAIYAGSYGWSSAGRFHHGQSQVHRFLNQFGGYSFSVNSYSCAGLEVIMPYIVGQPFSSLMTQVPTIEDIAENTELMVCFGGIPLKNTQVSPGGVGAHSARSQLKKLQKAGVSLINLSPIRDDVVDFLSPTWLPCRPNSDVAIMLALAHTLVQEDLHDREFLDEYCVGFDQFVPYLMGEADGQPKDACWASRLSEIPAGTIRDLARRMASQRTLISINWSLQRAQHGEQAPWMATTLAAMLGYLGLPGAGIAYGFGCAHPVGFHGRLLMPFKVASFPQGNNPVNCFIPSSRVTDMLLNPGKTISYRGETLTFPDIKLVYWVGGNPFHHHQDLNRLRRGWAKPETIICHDSVWTATARHSDIVLPATTFLERNDFSGGSLDRYLSPMHRVCEPYANSRDDYLIFSELAKNLGFSETFTEGRSEMQWIEHLYQETRNNARKAGVELPQFQDFWSGQQICLDEQLEPSSFVLEDFRRDRARHPLKTPSGKVEIFSQTIASYQYPDCHGHPHWYEKSEWLGAKRAEDYPLHLISNQPKTRLHSQYDHGKISQDSKIQGREPARMNPQDARSRGIQDGDVIRLFNDRGQILAGAIISDGIRPGVIQLATGAWYDPLEPTDPKSLDVHGNPNVLTRDQGTSSLAQGPTAHSCLIQVERFDDELPPIKAFHPPQQITIDELPQQK
ncbi:molybdopterin-dependent oxidoreductase [Dongshaea marina]|uniref:molybdopterin-dependent oxidoreductase n=1 Tax=Dongshaea marina TaxID=2047966 RepID=UPI000D3EB77B|nr:molybdopterin-dependent oxidoreductase [Dongshaea marina]